METIGSYFLNGCTGIKAIYVLSETPPTVSSGIFNKAELYDGPTLYVPEGTLEAYKAATIWSKFKKIEESTFTGISNIDAEAPAFEISAAGITFNNADGKTIEIYNVVGVAVEKIASYAGETISLDKGVYIVRIGEKTFKVRF